MTRRLHTLAPLLDEDGDPVLLHDLQLCADLAAYVPRCGECGEIAGRPHHEVSPLGKGEQYDGWHCFYVCRGVVLCVSDACLRRHLDRHRIEAERAREEKARDAA